MIIELPLLVTFLLLSFITIGFWAIVRKIIDVYYEKNRLKQEIKCLEKELESLKNNSN